ncbi:glucose-6-phosphate isomerase [uncultured Alsobacter sp.]|uniref:glucose-6-phosphate isomerase n=1 Tax=uncultured Alsobacter sp. TaxID=1748258 RepID=UPI0025EEA070|nr:glucose-6-phosphate isomerase [uncultured Alsobacter sp.]
MTEAPALAAAWAALADHRARTAATRIETLFAGDPDRFRRLSRRAGDLMLDLSKTALDAQALELLVDLARAAKVEERRDLMLSGAPINTTEGRAVLHTALRNRSDGPVFVDGEDVMPDVRAVLAAMAEFATGIRTGAIAPARGGRFTDVVNIGIGGSDLGPVMATIALAPWHDGPRSHFVSNVDGAHLADTLKGLDPATTLFIVASKTFTTIETMTNAASARRWIVAALGEDSVGSHFCAVSTALDKVAAFGISASRTFGFWDWVGGRYSVWSAVGLSVMIAVGPEVFGRFLDGAHAMDRHFAEAPLGENLPVLLGLAGIWHRNVCGYPSRAVLPYEQRLLRFPAYLQQLDMESNGKGVTLDGVPVSRSTGPIVWGEPGTNGQHAFYQLIHQGTEVIPCEFLVGARGHEPELGLHHDLLVANCLAQSQALMTGRTLEQATAQLRAAGRSESDVAAIAPHRVFDGNRPSITITYAILDPETLGALIALYEHRVFVEAQIWGINAFDQWGVELGKELAGGLLPFVQGGEAPAGIDGSTLGLVAALKAAARKP